MRLPASRDGLAPADSGGKSITRVIDKYFLAAVSWPSLLIMLLVTAVPFAVTIGLAFTNYNLVAVAWKFVGVRNFSTLIHDPQTPTILFNTVYLVVGTTVLDTLFGLGLAILLDTRIRGIGFIRSLYMLPIMTAPIVVALTWRAMFNNQAGWIDYFLSLAHLPQPVWLGTPSLAMPAVIISDMWTGIPFQALLLLVGLLNVPQELKQAAATDGANRLQVFWHITLPSMRPVLVVAVILRLIESYRKFEGIQILTTGGPGIASTTLNLQIYNTGLEYEQVGYAAAMGVVLILMIAISVGLVYLIAGRGNRWGGRS
jgi:multiple sugar transport system permease protein